MNTFASNGYTDFVLALGEGRDAITKYFLSYHLEDRDIEIVGGKNEIRYLTPGSCADWKVKLIDTGSQAETGSRIARCRRHLEGESFFVTYSDCLCNVDLASLATEHRSGGKLITVTGVQPNSRFGTFTMAGEEVAGYSLDTKLTCLGGYINSGYMAMSPGIFDHLDVFNECNLEREVFAKLAAARQVRIFPHNGYWQAVDTERDLKLVTQLYLDNKRPWLSLGGI